MSNPNSSWFMPMLVPFIAGCFLATANAPATAYGQSSASSVAQEPGLHTRPASVPVDTEGRIKLNVFVTGKQGAPVSGLELKDFTLLDNKKAQTILGFHAEAGSLQERQTPTEVILVLDAVNDSFRQAAFARQQTAKFLTKNDGHLTYPTTLAIFSTGGLRILPRPSSDGNALAAMLSQTSAAVLTAE